MKTIHKYKLEIKDIQEIEIPAFAQILSVQTQFETPCIWAMVDTDHKKVKYKFRTIGTGPQLDDDDVNGKYIGTYQLRGGELVFHVWQMIQYI